jgi:hypothetical protein
VIWEFFRAVAFISRQRYNFWSAKRVHLWRFSNFSNTLFFKNWTQEFIYHFEFYRTRRIN